MLVVRMGINLFYYCEAEILLDVELRFIRNPDAERQSVLYFL